MLGFKIDTSTMEVIEIEAHEDLIFKYGYFETVQEAKDSARKNLKKIYERNLVINKDIQRKISLLK